MPPSKTRTCEPWCSPVAGDSVFVSGADLKFLRDASPERRARNDSRMLALMDRLEAFPCL